MIETQYCKSVERGWTLSYFAIDSYVEIAYTLAAPQGVECVRSLKNSNWQIAKMSNWQLATGKATPELQRKGASTRQSLPYRIAVGALFATKRREYPGGGIDWGVRQRATTELPRSPKLPKLAIENQKIFITKDTKEHKGLKSPPIWDERGWHRGNIRRSGMGIAG